MELKPYQQNVIEDLKEFIDLLKQTKNSRSAYFHLWKKKSNNERVDYSENQIFNYLNLHPYDNAIPNVPRVTVKVPTAGGKTYIACNALKPIFDSYPDGKNKVVVWFVPSDTILKQTIKNLSDPEHPYRRRINTHFNHSVEIYDKARALQGANFNPTTLSEQLSILVLSIQSFSSNKKEDRKVYQENGNLMQFPDTYEHPENLLPDADITSLIQVINQSNPVVVIDESHNFEAEMRIEALTKINPSFIFELTATPRERSNIISFVDAIQLKRNNMVKLPVIVYNNKTVKEVVLNSIQLQKKLEEFAKQAESKGGKYIRPIVLFQAQPRSAQDTVTFEEIKNLLLALKIPEEQIKIKTANKNEIKDMDLMSRECEVRFIITVNALKEGWDCPFAYILATIADRSSPVDVEQILGRILRLPYTRQHSVELLNYSFVFTSSANFGKTLELIVKSLNSAGFSSRDYRISEEQQRIIEQENQRIFESDLFDNENANILDADTITTLGNSNESKKVIEQIITTARQQGSEYEKKIEEIEKTNNSLPIDIIGEPKVVNMRAEYVNEIKDIELPQFHIKQNVEGALFEGMNEDRLLEKNLLLQGFDLTKQDINIDFNLLNNEAARIDLAEARQDEHCPSYQYISYNQLERLKSNFASLAPEKQIRCSTNKLMEKIGNINYISDSHLRQYIIRILKSSTSDVIEDILEKTGSYSDKIKEKIVNLSTKYAKDEFEIMIESGKVFLKNSFEFQKRNTPNNSNSNFNKSLYAEEDFMNDFEKQVISEIINNPNVVFWHKNLVRGNGFKINGYLNHYPDFIIKMRNGKIVIIETKGPHLDNFDSKQKLELGRLWAQLAGNNYRYYMVFAQKTIDGSHTPNDLINILRQME